MKPACAAAFFFITLSAIASDVCACTIPVFRFALDRWDSDKFELLLPASLAADSAVADLLRPLRANGTANLSIVTSEDPAITTPQLRSADFEDQKIWSGELNAASLAQIIDSPVRQQILTRILAGESVIWIIAHDNSPEDLAEAERIEKRLRFLEQVASLPIQDPDDPDSQLGPGPALLLKFTTLRINRNDPTEAVFLKMLAGPTGDIDPATTSFAAAIFGRGRVLGACALDELDDVSMEESSMFLIGRCSCSVKDQIPGWDILLNVDWDKALSEADTPDTSAPSLETASPVTVLTLPSGTAPTTSHTLTSTTVEVMEISWLWLAAAGLVILTLIALLLRKK